MRECLELMILSAQLAESLKAIEARTEVSKKHSTITELGGGVWIDATMSVTLPVTPT